MRYWTKNPGNRLGAQITSYELRIEFVIQLNNWLDLKGRNHAGYVFAVESLGATSGEDENAHHWHGRHLRRNGHFHGRVRLAGTKVWVAIGFLRIRWVPNWIEAEPISSGINSVPSDKFKNKLVKMSVILE